MAIKGLAKREANRRAAEKRKGRRFQITIPEDVMVALKEQFPDLSRIELGDLFEKIIAEVILTRKIKIIVLSKEVKDTIKQFGNQIKRVGNLLNVTRQGTSFLVQGILKGVLSNVLSKKQRQMLMGACSNTWQTGILFKLFTKRFQEWADWQMGLRTRPAEAAGKFIAMPIPEKAVNDELRNLKKGLVFAFIIDTSWHPEVRKLAREEHDFDVTIAKRPEVPGTSIVSLKYPEAIAAFLRKNGDGTSRDLSEILAISAAAVDDNAMKAAGLDEKFPKMRGGFIDIGFSKPDEDGVITYTYKGDRPADWVAGVQKYKWV